MVTLTSAEENTWVVENLADITGWVGGFQPDGNPEPDGNWQWVTGETWDWTNWAAGEPNNQGNEGFLIFMNVSQWNDWSNHVISGYIIEYESIPEPATINLKEVKIKFKDKPNNDKFKIEGGFTLGKGNNGIDPIVEDVIVNVGSSSIVIAAPYSFEEEKAGVFKYKGIINSTDVEMEIKTKDYVTYNFKVKVKNVDLTDTANPVDVELNVGDDTGKTNIRLKGELKSKENEK